MSLLLDALRKAEQERRLGQPPSAFDEPPVTPVTDRPRSRLARYRSSLLLGLVILLALALLGLLTRPPATEGDSGPQAQAQASPSPAAVRLPEPAPRRPSSESLTPDPRDLERLDSLDSLVLPPPPPRPRAVMTASGEVPAGAPSPEEGLLTREPEDGNVLSDADGSQPDDGTPPPTTVDLRFPADEETPPGGALAAEPAESIPSDPSLPPADIQPPGPPLLSELPAAERERLPGYRFDVHVWNADPSRRFVLLNGKRYREGDRTDEGPILVEILEDGLVIEAEGRRVRIPRPG